MSWHVVCDTFSWHGWRFEGAERILGPVARPRLWKRFLERPPDTDFLLVEPPWEGFFDRTRFMELAALIRAFRKKGVPVVFWNKEDPEGFLSFGRLALLSDLVLTTDAGVIPRYRRVCRAPVDLLTFAAQPAFHRAYLPKDPRKKLFFAGDPRLHYAARRRAFDYLLVPSLRYGLDIFARTTENVPYACWPRRMKPAVKGSLPYPRLVRAYSAYQCGLAIHSTPESLTMFSRRTVEMPLADVFVLSSASRAVRALFPEIPQSADRAGAVRMLGYYLDDRHAAERIDLLQALKKRICSSHTCAHAYQRIRALLRLR